MNTYHVTCNTDNKYAQHCNAMLCSLFDHNKNLHFHVHILTHNLSEDNITQLKSLAKRYNEELTFYEVDESKLEGVKFRKQNPLSKAAYYRILLPEIIDKSINKILYLDCDIIIIDEISEIFEYEIDNYALGACIDASPFNQQHRKQLGLGINEYAFNSGVMIINLDYWRKKNAEQELLRYSKRDRKQVLLHDQDSLNYVFKHQWLAIPPKWNHAAMSIIQRLPGEKDFDFYEYAYEPKLIHYAGKETKPWITSPFPEKNLYIKYLKISGFKNPTFIKFNHKQNRTLYKLCLSYWIHKYIIPYTPRLFLIVLSDIINIFLSLYYLTLNRNGLKAYKIKRLINI